MFNGVWHRILHDQTAESIARARSRGSRTPTSRPCRSTSTTAPTVAARRTGNGAANGERQAQDQGRRSPTASTVAPPIARGRRRRPRSVDVGWRQQREGARPHPGAPGRAARGQPQPRVHARRRDRRRLASCSSAAAAIDGVEIGASMTVEGHGDRPPRPARNRQPGVRTAVITRAWLVDIQRRSPLLAGRVRHAPHRRPDRRACSSPTRSTSTRSSSSSRATCSSSRRATPTGIRSARTRAGARASCGSSTSTRSRSPSTTATECSSRSGNIRAHAEVGMLFIDFEHPNRCARERRRDASTETIRCSRRCRARSSSCACATTQVFPNCSRYIHKMQLRRALEVRSRTPNVAPPIPDWKRMTWAQDHLPEGDPAHASRRYAC